MSRFWIAWNRKTHTLKWTYSEMSHSWHPVEFVGMDKYTHHNFCLIFPKISKREWAYLMRLRNHTPQGLSNAELKFSNEFFKEISIDVFSK